MIIKYLSHYEVTAVLQDGLGLSGFMHNGYSPRLGCGESISIFESPSCDSSYVEVRSEEVVRLHVNPITSDKPL